ncbi:DUF3097 domain-containing protein [Enemella sp. A6]|uniref:DUF3097 domain-containing protein n=1 Tax=Enemella sp. A6 TaxID=3440152 RepID=UPI003EBBAFB2
MRYDRDPLAPGWQQAGRPKSAPVTIEKGLVVEDPTTGFVGAVTSWEHGAFVLEDRRGKIRSFPFGPGFWIDGKPVAITPANKAAPRKPTHTRSGSRVGPSTPARVALPSRIYVEGRHDAELIEKVWGDDLRHVGVVVEFLGGIDDLDQIINDFRPGPGRRLGVLVDHLVPGSKESRIIAEAGRGYTEYLMVTGHEYIDIWQAVDPSRIGIKAWPQIPKGQDWKTGTCRALGWPHGSQADIARAWQHILSRVDSWTDLDRRLCTEVEKLIDFVTADHPMP